MRAAGFRVSWIGPDRPRDLETYGVDFHFYPMQPTRTRRMFHGLSALKTSLDVSKVDVFFAVEPDSALVAAALAKVRGARAVFDIHEDYDGPTLRRWVGGPAFPAAAALVRGALGMTCRAVDLVVGVNKTVLEPYKGTGTQQMVIRSCAPKSFADGPPADVHGKTPGQFVAVQGKSTLHHGTDTIVRAAGLIRDRIPGLEIVFFDHFAKNVGFTREAFDELVESVGATDNIDLRPMIPMLEMPAVLRASDVGLVAPNRVLGTPSLPNKVFEFMAAGLPLIAPDYAPEIVKVVEQSDCGLLVDTESPEAIAGALLELYENPEEAKQMGSRGREAFLSRYCWEREFEPFIDYVREWAHA